MKRKEKKETTDHYNSKGNNWHIETPERKGGQNATSFPNRINKRVGGKGHPKGERNKKGGLKDRFRENRTTLKEDFGKGEDKKRKVGSDKGGEKGG